MGLSPCCSPLLSSISFSRSDFRQLLIPGGEGHPGFGRGRNSLIGTVVSGHLCVLCACVRVQIGTEGREGARSEARGRPNMASEDALEDLPGDQPVDSTVYTEQGDTESPVGNRGQGRPRHGCLFCFR